MIVRRLRDYLTRRKSTNLIHPCHAHCKHDNDHLVPVIPHPHDYCHPKQNALADVAETDRLDPAALSALLSAIGHTADLGQREVLASTVLAKLLDTSDIIRGFVATYGVTARTIADLFPDPEKGLNPSIPILGVLATYALTNSGKEARYRGTETIGAEHLLLGILQTGNSPVAQYLKARGITYKETLGKLLGVHPSLPEPDPGSPDPQPNPLKTLSIREWMLNPDRTRMQTTWLELANAYDHDYTALGLAINRTAADVGFYRVSPLFIRSERATADRAPLVLPDSTTAQRQRAALYRVQAQFSELVLGALNTAPDRPPTPDSQ